jgi:GntR family histidine utilization transcriptional repressor
MKPGVVARPAPSLHLQILNGIRERILSGEWPPGHRIPFEHELTAIYRCSRMTVSKALTELSRAGLIERRRKAGTFVKIPQSQSAVLELRDIRSEVAALGLPYRFEMISRREAKAADAGGARLGLSASTRVLELGCRHFAGERPFCLEERLINLSAVPDARNERFEELAPGAWLVRHAPWTTAEHRIRAAAADAATASLLLLERRAACLLIERRTWSSEGAVTFVRLIYPADSHELIARFSPSDA